MSEVRLQLLYPFGPLFTQKKKKKLLCKGCQIIFPGTVRFSKCIPVGHNFLGSCFRRKGHGENLQKRKWETEILTLWSQNQTWFFTINLHTHTPRGTPESDLRGVCMAPAAGQTNPPGFGMVVPEVDAQLEQDQTVLTRAVRRDRTGRALVISGHSRALINTGCFSKTHFPAQQPLSPSAFGQAD